MLMTLLYVIVIVVNINVVREKDQFGHVWKRQATIFGHNSESFYSH